MEQAYITQRKPGFWRYAFSGYFDSDSDLTNPVKRLYVPEKVLIQRLKFKKGIYSLDLNNMVFFYEWQSLAEHQKKIDSGKEEILKKFEISENHLEGILNFCKLIKRSRVVLKVEVDSALRFPDL